MIEQLPKEHDEGREEILSDMIIARFPHLNALTHEAALCELANDLLQLIAKAECMAAQDARNDELANATYLEAVNEG